MMKKLISIFSLFFILSGICFAQNFSDFIRAADKCFENGDYYRATLLYQKAMQKSNTEEVSYKLAESARLSHDYDLAEKMYFKLFQDSVKRYPLLRFRLAEMQKYQGKYQVAQRNFRAFADTYPEKESYFSYKASQEVISCEKAIDLRFNPIGVDIIQMDTLVNTVNSEYGISVTKDKLFFSSMRTDSLEYRSQVYWSERSDSLWNRSKSLDTLVNINGRNIANPFWDSKDSILYFTVQENTVDGVFSAIYYSSFITGRWSNPERLTDKINFPGCNNTHPCIAETPSGKIIFFSSDRSGGEGGFDIWYSVKKSDGFFSDPLNAGKELPDIDAELAHFIEVVSVVNTLGNEITPYYNPKDSVLYFSSDWHPGLGGYDIFKTRTDLKKWGEVENLGFPINSNRNDLYYTHDPKHHFAFLASNRKEALTEKNESCCNDLFYYEMPGFVDEEELERNKIKVFEKEIKLLVPLTLYFHNDEPNPRTTDTVTSVNYENNVKDYIQMLEIYKKEFSRGLKKNEKDESIAEVETFFRFNIEGGYSKLIEFAQLTEELLQKGQTIVITMKGYTSPLHSTEYNAKLARRRISSLMNYFDEYKAGVFLPFKESGLLIYEEVPIGEELVNQNVSDDVNDVRNSVYNPLAAAERRIQIIAVSVTEQGVEEFLPEELTPDEDVQEEMLPFDENAREQIPDTNLPENK